MKVVLFCGGSGMRMRTAEDDIIPKPLQMEVADLIPENGDLVGDACMVLAANTFEERAEPDAHHTNGIRPSILWDSSECRERLA